MNKKIWGVVGIIIIVIFVWLGFRNTTSTPVPVSQAPIVLGFIAPLSGDAVGYGTTEKNATELALAEINQAGGVNNRMLTVVYEDGKCNAKDALSAMEKLISIDKVKIVMGGTCSAETLAVAPLAEKNNVILFSAFSSNPEITNAGDYIFRNAPSDTDATRVDAETIISKGYKKVAIVSENTEYSLGVRTILKDILSRADIDIISDEVYNAQSTQDFRSLLTKVGVTKPDVLYLNPGTSAKAGGLMVKQARELKLSMPIHGNFSLGTPESLTTGGSYMEGVVTGDSTGLGGKGKILLGKYQTQFKAEPANEYLMGAAYDRVYLLRDALAGGTDNTDKIKTYFYGLKNFSGAVGDYHFDQNGDVVGVGFASFVIKDGKKVLYNQQ